MLDTHVTRNIPDLSAENYKELLRLKLPKARHTSLPMNQAPSCG